MDPRGRRVTFNLTVPVASLSGRYDVKGNILGATVSSRGTFASEIREFSNRVVICIVQCPAIQLSQSSKWSVSRWFSGKKCWWVSRAGQSVG